MQTEPHETSLQNTGAGRYDRLRRGLWSTIGMCVAIVLLLGVALRTFAVPLAELFGVDFRKYTHSKRRL